MITPIKDETRISGCSNALVDIIPDGYVVDSYMFYDGKLEFDLTDAKIFVNAHTISKPVYLFWECLREDPARLHEITLAIAEKFSSESEFTVLQEIWHLNRNPFMVASTFFLLNRCSRDGLISSGDLEPSRYNPLALSRLAKFKFPDNFHLNHYLQDPIDSINKTTSADCILIPAGKFNYNLFEYGKNLAIEETPLNHRALSAAMKNKDKKIVAVYNYHAALKKAFNSCNLIFVNEHGKTTSREELAKEVIIANF